MSWFNKSVGGLEKDIFGSNDCNKGIEIPIIDKWIGRGKHYGKCPCDKNKCPSGYFNLFNDIYDEKNPIDKSIMKSGYYMKTCGDISGKYPHESSWDKSTFNKCNNFYNLHKGINEELRKLKPLSQITSVEPFSPSEETYERVQSFNSLLKEKVEKDKHFLNNQIHSSNQIKKANDNFNEIVGDFYDEKDRLNQSIYLKTRLAEINNEAAREKHSTIMNILGSSAALFIFIFAIIGYQTGKISTTTMLTMFVIAVIVFFILAIRLNSYAMKKFRKISNKLEKEIVHKGDKLNIKALEWIDDNCDCGDESSKNKLQKQKTKIEPSTFTKENDHLQCDSTDNITDIQNKLNRIKKEKNKLEKVLYNL